MPDYNDSRKALYDALKDRFEYTDSYEEFSSKMDDPQKRKNLYNVVSKKYDLGDFEDYEKKIAQPMATQAKPKDSSEQLQEQQTKEKESKKELPKIVTQQEEKKEIKNKEKENSLSEDKEEKTYDYAGLAQSAKNYLSESNNLQENITTPSDNTITEELSSDIAYRDNNGNLKVFDSKIGRSNYDIGTWLRSRNSIEKATKEYKENIIKPDEKIEKLKNQRSIDSAKLKLEHPLISKLSDVTTNFFSLLGVRDFFDNIMPANGERRFDYLKKGLDEFEKQATNEMLASIQSGELRDYILKESERLGVDPEQYAGVFAEKVSSDLGKKISKALIEDKMPKNDIEYILDHAVNSIGGLIFCALTESPDEFAAHQMAMEEYKNTHNPSIIVNTLGELTPLVCDGPFFTVFGLESKPIAQGIKEAAINAYIKTGARRALFKSSAETLKNLTKLELNSSLNGRLLNFTYENLINQTITLPQYEALRNAAYQAASNKEHEIDLKEVVKAYGEGLKMAVPVALTGGVIKGSTATAVGYGKLLSELGGITAEGLTFSYAGAMAKGEDLPTLEENLKSIMTIGVMHGSHQVGNLIKPQKGTTRRDVARNIKDFWTGQAKASIPESMRLTEQDKQQLADNNVDLFNVADDFTKVASKVDKIRKAEQKAKKNAKGESKNNIIQDPQLEKELQEAEQRFVVSTKEFLDNPEIDYDLKIKVALSSGLNINDPKIAEQIKQLRMPAAMSADVSWNEENGSGTIIVRDVFGNRIKTNKYDNKKEFDRSQENIQDAIISDNMNSLLSAGSIDVRNVKEELKRRGFSDEDISKAESKINTLLFNRDMFVQSQTKLFSNKDKSQNQNLLDKLSQAVNDYRDNLKKLSDNDREFLKELIKSSYGRSAVEALWARSLTWDNYAGSILAYKNKDELGVTVAGGTMRNANDVVNNLARVQEKAEQTLSPDDIKALKDDPLSALSKFSNEAEQTLKDKGLSEEQLSTIEKGVKSEIDKLSLTSNQREAVEEYQKKTEDLQTAIDFVRMQEMFFGINNEFSFVTEDKVKQAMEKFDSFYYRDKELNVTGELHKATFKDGTQKYVINGDVKVNEDGSFEVANNELIYTIDEQTGEKSTYPGSDIVSYQVLSKDQVSSLRLQVANKIRQDEQIANTDLLNGTVHFKAGDVYQMRDDDGNDRKMKLLLHATDEQGDPILNTYILEDEDGEQVVMTGDAIQQQVNNFNKARLLGEKPKLNPGDLVTFEKDGQNIKGTIKEISEDGKITVTTEQGDVQVDEDAISKQKSIAMTEEQAAPTIDENTPSNTETPLEQVQEKSPLEKIPIDDKGNRLWSQAPDVATGYDALVEFFEGDEAKALKNAKKLFKWSKTALEKAKKALEGEDEKETEPKTIEELKAEEEAKEEAVKSAEKEVAFWEAVIKEPEVRKQSQQAQEEKVVSEENEQTTQTTATNTTEVSPTVNQTIEQQVQDGVGENPPSEAQKEAGNYPKIHVKVNGFDISIENPQGSVRQGTSPNGHTWSITMKNHYGYIKGTKGKDGGQIDVFLGPNPEKGRIFVVDQVDPKTGKFDEHKVMMGFDNLEDAKKAYLSNYEEGWKGLGNITEVSLDDFKDWIKKSKKKTKPFSEYAEIQKKKNEIPEKIKGFEVKKTTVKNDKGNDVQVWEITFDRPLSQNQKNAVKSLLYSGLNGHGFERDGKYYAKAEGDAIRFGNEMMTRDFDKVDTSNMSLFERNDRLGDYYDFEDWLLRNLPLMHHCIVWGDHPTIPTIKGLGSHLGLKNSKTDRWFFARYLTSAEKGGMYPEKFAEFCISRFKDDASREDPGVDQIEAFNMVLDVISRGKPKELMAEAEKNHELQEFSPEDIYLSKMSNIYDRYVESILDLSEAKREMWRDICLEHDREWDTDDLTEEEKKEIAYFIKQELDKIPSIEDEVIDKIVQNELNEDGSKITGNDEVGGSVHENAQSEDDYPFGYPVDDDEEAPFKSSKGLPQNERTGTARGKNGGSVVVPTSLISGGPYRPKIRYNSYIERIGNIERLTQILNKKYKNLPIVLLDSQDALFKEAARQGEGYNILNQIWNNQTPRAWAKNGKIYINVPAVYEEGGNDIQGALDFVEELLWHEGGVHISLRDMMRDKDGKYTKFRNFCQRVYRSMNPEQQKGFFQYQWNTTSPSRREEIFKELSIEKNPLSSWEDLNLSSQELAKIFASQKGMRLCERAAEEYMAHCAQIIYRGDMLPGQDISVWQKIKHLICKALGLDKDITDDDIARLIRKSSKDFFNRDWNNPVLSDDKDVNNVQYMVREDLAQDPLLENVATKYYKSDGGSLANEILEAKNIEDLNKRLDELSETYKNLFASSFADISAERMRADFKALLESDYNNNYQRMAQIFGLPTVDSSGKQYTSADDLTYNDMYRWIQSTNNLLNNGRRQVVNEWTQALKNYSPAERYIVYRTLAREARQEKEVSPITYIKEPFEATMQELRVCKNPQSFDFYTSYARNILNSDIKDAGQETIKVTSSDPSQKSGKWIRFPASENHTKDEIETIKAMVAAASTGTDWCTRHVNLPGTGAQKIIQEDNHDIYFFIPDGESAKMIIIPIRPGEENDLTQGYQSWYSGIFKESNGKNNEIDPEYLDAVAQLYKKTKNEDLRHTLEYLNCDDATIEKKKEVFAQKEDKQVSWLNNHTQERFTKGDVENIKNNFGITLHTIKDGSLSLPTFNSAIYEKVMMGARDKFFSMLFNSIKAIEGDIDITDAPISSLGSVETIGGDAILTKAKFETLGNLKQVRGDLNLSGSKVTSLGELEYVGGDINIESSKVKDLGKLVSIKGNLILKNSRITSLGDNLIEILKDADFSFSNVTDFGQLALVKGNLNLRGCRGKEKKSKNAEPITLQKLHVVGGDVDLRNNSALESLGELSIIKGDLDMEGSSVKSLGELTEVRGDATFNESLEDIGELYYIGGRDNLDILGDEIYQRYIKNSEKRYRDEILSNVAGQKMSEQDIDNDALFSSRQRRKDEYLGRLNHDRKDLSPEERDNVASYLVDYPDHSVAYAALHWFARKAINLDEDMNNVAQAVDVAKRVNVKIQNFDNPMALLWKYAEFTPTGSRVDPDTVPCLIDKKELPEGITIYTIDAPKWNGSYDGEGDKQLEEIQSIQLALRKVIDTHFGKNCNPWCLLAGDGDGGMGEDAMYHWNNYDGYPKQIAFKNGKLYAFSASSSDKETWWDRTDHDYEGGIPITKRIIGDPLKRKEEYLIDTKTGEISKEPVRIFKGDRDNGFYQEWWPENLELIKEESVYEYGVKNGLSKEYNHYGQLLSEGEYNDGIAIGEHNAYYPDATGDKFDHDQTFYDDNGYEIKASRTWNSQNRLVSYRSYGEYQRNIGLCWGKNCNLTSICEFSRSNALDGLKANRKKDGTWEGQLWKGNRLIKYLKSDEVKQMLSEREAFIDKIWDDNFFDKMEPTWEYDELKYDAFQENAAMFSSRKDKMNSLNKRRPDMTPEEKNALLDYLETIKDRKISDPAFDWFVKGTIKLPEDLYKVKQAVSVANKTKDNPADYVSPIALMNAHTDVEPVLERIDPDTVPTLKNKREIGGGVTIYDVEDTELSRRNMRKIIDTHFGVKANPWCLLQTDEKGEFTGSSSSNWEYYSAYPKMVAFKNGKLLAFSANSYRDEKWWNRVDESTDGLEIERDIPGDPLGRRARFFYYDNDFTYGKSYIQSGHSYKGNKQNGLYQEWDLSDNLVLEVTYKNGKKDGEEKIYHSNGQLRSRCFYKDDKPVGVYESWYTNRQQESRCNYNDDGELDGLSEWWDNNGQQRVRKNYKNGKLDGLEERWYNNDNHQIQYRVKYKDGKKEGKEETWFEDGRQEKISHYKNNLFHGTAEKWYDNDNHQIAYRYNYVEGGKVGLQETWYENGQRKLREILVGPEEVDIKRGMYAIGLSHQEWYKNGRRSSEYEFFEDGSYRKEGWYESGHIEYREKFKASDDFTEESFFEDGHLLNKTVKKQNTTTYYVWDEGEGHPLISEEIDCEDGSRTLKELYPSGRLQRLLIEEDSDIIKGRTYVDEEYSEQGDLKFRHGFINGVPEGLQLRYVDIDSDELLSREFYVNGKPVGQQLNRESPDEEFNISTYKDGRKVGLQQTTYYTGFKKERYYLNEQGLKEGPYERFSRYGEIMTKGNMKNGQFDGLVYFWFPDSKELSCKAIYHDGKPDGPYQEFICTDGENFLCQGNMVNGKKDGIWYELDLESSSDEIRKNTYDMGILVKKGEVVDKVPEISFEEEKQMDPQRRRDILLNMPERRVQDDIPNEDLIDDAMFKSNSREDRRSQMMHRLDKHCHDLTETQKKAIIEEVESLETSKERIAAFNWFLKGKIQIPKDLDLVRYAINILESKAKDEKRDVGYWSSPFDIFEEYGSPIKDEAIDPDTLPFLIDKKEYPESGLTIYTIDEKNFDSEQVRKSLREVIDTHFGEDANPWCLLAKNPDGYLTSSSCDYWHNTYNAYPKRIAFQNGKLVAFSANNRRNVVWWNRYDNSHPGIPAEKKVPGDPLRRKAMYYFFENTGKWSSEPVYYFKGDMKNGPYEEWVKNNQTGKLVKTLSTNYRKGKKDGLTETWFTSGYKKEEYHCKEGEYDGSFKEWDQHGRIMYEYNYKHGERIGEQKTYHDNGRLSAQYNIDEDGNYDGKYQEWDEDGNILRDENRVFGLLDGEYYYKDIYNRTSEHGFFKRDFRDGLWERYEIIDDKEKLSFRGLYKDGKKIGAHELYDPVTGRLQYIETYDEHGDLKKKESFHRNEEIRYIENYKDGKLDGEALWFYPNRKLKSKYNYKDGKLDGEYKDYYEDGNIELEATFKDGIEIGTSTSYYENSHRLRSRNTFNNNGDPVKVEKWYENGHRYTLFEFYENKKHKTEQRFYDDGHPEYSKFWNEDGKEDGHWQSWYKNHQLKEDVFFKDGKKIGESTKFHDNGQTEYVDRYDNKGLRQGLSEGFDNKGNKLFETNYKDGKKDGEEKRWTDNVLTYICHWKDGKEDGLAQGWTPVNKSLYQYNYKNGEKDGLCIDYDDKTENIIRKLNFKKNKLHGLCEYYIDGKIQKRERYVDGNRSGIRELYQDGRLESKTEYLKNQKCGVCEHYYPLSGKLKIKCNYYFGNIEGDCFYYNEDDSINHIIHYEDGNQFYTDYYNNENYNKDKNHYVREEYDTYFDTKTFTTYNIKTNKPIKEVEIDGNGRVISSVFYDANGVMHELSEDLDDTQFMSRKTKQREDTLDKVENQGLKEIYGDRYNDFLDDIFKDSSEDVRREISSIASKNGLDFRKATQEYLSSYLIQDNFDKDSRSWKNIRRAFNNMLKASDDELAGYGYNQDSNLSDDEIRYMIARSNDIEQGDNSLFSIARAADLKNRTGMDAMFKQMKEDSQKKSLVGVHNIDIDKFRRAMNLGGFANPSIAVYNPNEYEHFHYGKISLIMPNNKIDARSGRNAGTFNGDAWTPMFPVTYKDWTNVGRKAFDDDLMKFPEEIREFVKRGFDEYRENQKEDYVLPYMFYVLEKKRKPNTITYSNGKIDPMRTVHAVADYIYEHPFMAEQYRDWMLMLDGRYDMTDKLLYGITPEGNRQFKPATLDNISSYMKSQGRNGANEYKATFTDFMNSVMTSMRSLNEIRKNSHRLKTYEDIEAFEKKWMPVMERLGAKLSHPGLSSDLLNGYNFLIEMAKSGNPREFFKQYGQNREFSEEDFKELDSMINAIRKEKPSVYFETKFERPVKLDEFAVAVVPRENVSEIAPYLEQAGVKMLTYKDRKERFDKVRQVVQQRDDIQFKSTATRSPEEILEEIPNQKSLYMDPSPLELEDFSDEAMFSARDRHNNWMKQLDNHRPDMTTEQKEALIKYVDSLQGGALKNATFYWFVKRQVSLPQDIEKIKQAVSVASRVGEDPISFDNPDSVILKYPKIKPIVDPINPDDVPTLTSKKDLGGGITVYNVDESMESRENMRKIINTHWGPDANPWCLLQGDGEGNLDMDYANKYNYWEKYSLYPKKVAFLNGRLLAFSAHNYEYNKWWNRMDKEFYGIPFTKPLNDGTGRVGTYLWDENKREWTHPQNIHKGNRENGVYQEWYDEENIHIDAFYKNGKLDGTYKSYYPGGKLSVSKELKNGCLYGITQEYWPNNQLKYIGEYKNDMTVGEHKHFYDDGHLMTLHTYDEDGLQVGKQIHYYENHMLAHEKYYNKDHKPIGYESYYSSWGSIQKQYFRDIDGRLLDEKHWFDYTADDVLESRHRIKYLNDGSRMQLDETWYDNSKPQSISLTLSIRGEKSRPIIEKGWDIDGNVKYDYTRIKKDYENLDMLSAEEKEVVKKTTSSVLKAIKKQKSPELINKSAQEQAPIDNQDEAIPLFSSRQIKMNRLNKHRKDMTDKQKNALLDYLETINDRKISEPAFDWFVKGTIKLPEDLYKVKQAVSVAKQAKVNPASYISPMALLEANVDFEPTGERIDPDTVPTLKNKKEEDYGITIYDVEDSEESRINMRKIIDSHFGKKANPWCLLEADENGNLTKSSEEMWENYSAYPKQVAFQNGKLIAFSANELTAFPANELDIDEDAWKEQWDEYEESNDYRIPEPQNYDFEVLWWNRMDKESHGIPIVLELPDDELGRKAEYEYYPDVNAPGFLSSPQRIFKGNEQNGLYQEWDTGTGNLIKEEHYKNGKLEGLCKYFDINTGDIAQEHNYKNDKRDGESKYYYDFAENKLAYITHYKEGIEEGWRKEFANNGNNHLEAEGYVSNFKSVGQWKYYDKDGNLKAIKEYNDKGKKILVQEYWPNGQKKEERKYDENNTSSTFDEKKWDEDGNLLSDKDDEALFSSRQMSPSEAGERMREARLGISQAAIRAAQLREQVKNSPIGRLQDIRKAFSSQREYDRTTLKRFTSLVNDMLKAGILDATTRGDLERMVSAIGNVLNGSSWDKTEDTNLIEQVDKLFDVAAKAMLRQNQENLNNLLKLKATKENDKGLTVMGKMDVRGQRLHQEIKHLLTSQDLSIEKLEQMENDLTDALASENDIVKEDAQNKYVAIQIAKKYATEYLDNYQSEKKMLEDLKAKLAETPKQMHKQMEKTTRDAIRESVLERAQALQEISTMLESEIISGVLGARNFHDEQFFHQQAVLHDWNKDMMGRNAKAHRGKDTFAQRLSNNTFVRFFLSPLLSFEQILRMVGSDSINGEGYTWDRFVRGWQDCNDQEFRSKRQATDELDKRVSEIFGKKMRFSDLYKQTRKASDGLDIEIWDDGQKVTKRLTPGNLLYIYMANKMSDGKMKLSYMGITDEDVERIKDHLDPKLIDLADWLQNDFLVRQREKYNQVYERMFGASMANIDNYFPLKILSNARQEKVDMTGQDNEALPATMTGAIIKRTKNTLPLDITNTDALDVVIEHLDQMEHWAAFGEYNRDLCTLLSYKRARNHLMNMSSIYGGGELLWRNFKDCAYMAGGAYVPKTSGKNGLDTLAVNMAKGVTGAKIAFRLFTAMKQILSSPAFFGQAGIAETCQAIVPWTTCKWAMENLPGFSKRWLSRQAGDTRLMQTESDWEFWKNETIQKISRAGITPNAAVDALTVAIGARAVYLTKKKKYLAQGYSEADAEASALQDAATAYNQSQQSSESIFVSPMQVDRSFLSVCLTIYRNASMAYTRQAVDGARNLARLIQGGKNHRENLIFNYTRKLESHGVDHETAQTLAKKEYLKSWSDNLVKVGVFGFGLELLWNMAPHLFYYLLGKDDEKKKDYIVDDLVHGIFGSTEGLSAGDRFTSVISGLIRGQGLSSITNNLDLDFMPALSDLNTITKEIGYDKWRALNDFIGLVIQSNVGVNPSTITDVAVAIMDGSNYDLTTAREVATLLARIAQIPQSQLDNLYFDELDMTGAEAKKLSPHQMAQRYALYKAKRAAFLAIPLYNDEEWEKAVGRYEKTATKKAKEFIGTTGEKEINDKYLQLEEQYKEYKAMQDSISAIKKEDKNEYKRRWNAWKNSKEYQFMKDFKFIDNKLKEHINGYLTTDRADSAKLFQDSVLYDKKFFVDYMEKQNK